MNRLLTLFLLLLLADSSSSSAFAKESWRIKGTLTETDKADLAKASAVARSRWNEFVQAVKSGQAKKDELLYIKTKFKDGKNIEHMWVEPLDLAKLDGPKIVGKLANTPLLVKNIKEGDRVTIKKSAVEDWEWVGDDHIIRGCFTVVVLEKIEKREKAKKKIR